MKTTQRWLKLILCFSMLLLLTSCFSPYIPNDNRVRNISPEDAREVLVAQLKGRQFCFADPNFCIGKISKEIARARVTSHWLVLTDNEGKKTAFNFKKFPDIVYKRYPSEHIKLSTEPDVIIFSFWDSGNDIANALYVLRQNAIRAEKESGRDDAGFAASLDDYRKKAVSNTALPEEANRYKVQAEGAVRDKEFYDAVEFYAEALKIAPWWPAGHFNRALVLGEIDEYGEARREMKRYLQLVPNATNARAAQDKIYDWERLEAK